VGEGAGEDEDEGEVGERGRYPVMSGKRTDNEALLDYTDLFGPGRAPSANLY